MKIGMAQMLVEGGNWEDNLQRAEQMIGSAAQQECDIVVLPECLDIGWTHGSAKTLAEPIPGRTSERLMRAATQFRIYVVAGLTERDRDDIYNSAILISPNGDILLKHRKINELDIAHHLYSNGDRLGVAKTPIGTIAMNICADNAPGSLALGHSLARMGAQIILSPSSWAVPADHDNETEPYGRLWEGSYTKLAKLYNMPVVGVSNVGELTDGPWANWKCIGCSLAVGADGEVMAKGPYGERAEQLIVVDMAIPARNSHGTRLVEEVLSRGYYE